VPGTKFDPRRAGVRVYFAGIRRDRVDLHAGDAPARRVRQPDGELLRNACRSPDVIGRPVEEILHRDAAGLIRNPGRQRPVPGIVGQHDEIPALAVPALPGVRPWLVGHYRSEARLRMHYADDDSVHTV
jgi:hypothetical protein